MKAVNKKPGLSKADIDRDAILLRAYGKGTDVLIDRKSTPETLPSFPPLSTPCHHYPSTLALELILSQKKHGHIVCSLDTILPLPYLRASTTVSSTSSYRVTCASLLIFAGLKYGEV